MIQNIMSTISAHLPLLSMYYCIHISDIKIYFLELEARNLKYSSKNSKLIDWLEFKAN